MAEMLSLSELQENIATYSEQLNQVKELLAADPNNDEYKEMATGLEEVLQLTRDLLETAKQSSNVLQENLPALERGFSGDGQLTQGEETLFSVGKKVQALWSGDGKWYEAVIRSVCRDTCDVTFSGWGNVEKVGLSSIRPLSSESSAPAIEEPDDILTAAEREAEAARQAIKRKVMEAATTEISPKEVPAKLRINPDDSEEVKAAKRKKIHAFKSRQRQELLDLAQNKKQNSWQKFQGKGKSKKLGFFTGRKKDSIFKSPEEVSGKVGVVGSGQGMTDFHKREKFIKGKTTPRMLEDI